MVKRALLLIALAPAAFLSLPAAVALAHATVVSAQPAPGAELGTAPGVVVVRFSEPLNRALSKVTVVDPNGRTFTGRASAARTIQVPLSTNAFGTYHVDWTTVSTLDGHTLRGSYTFGVGVSKVGAGGAEAEPGLGAWDRAIAVARTLEDVGLLVGIGALAIGRLAEREPVAPWARHRRRWSLTLALVGGMAVVLGEARLAAGGWSAGAIVGYLTTGLPGISRLARIASEAFAVVGSYVSPIPMSVGLVGATIALSASGHAAAADPRWWGIGIDWVHLVSAGVWAGGIMALGLLRPPGGWRGPEGRRLLDRFSPVAIAAFLITAATGAARGVQEVGSFGELFGSSYGRVLVVKVSLVGAMVPLSALMWRRRLGSPRLESALAVGVIGAAAVLSAFPFPPGREAAPPPPAVSQISALPGPGDLTLGGEAGQVAVGLTLRPGDPGRNQVFVYLLPLQGAEAAGALVADLSVDGRSVDLRTCAASCRRGTVNLRGGEEVTVRVEGGTGGTATFHLPDLPAPDGSALLDRMMRRMHEVRTYRLDERLASGLTVVRSRYSFVAPYEMTQRSRAPGIWSDVVWIGRTRYLKSGPDEPWAVQVGGRPTKVPTYVWDFFQPFQDARVVGSERVDGVPTQTVASYGENGGLPVWFELWIDADGIVHRGWMRTQGHFMYHRYFDLGAPIRIAPPPGA